MSLPKLSLAGNNLIIPGQGQFGDMPAGEEKSATFFYRVKLTVSSGKDLRRQFKIP
jgi:hypothetical protein